MSPCCQAVEGQHRMDSEGIGRQLSRENEGHMKQKSIKLAVALLTAFLLTGCGANQEADAGTDTNTDKTTNTTIVTTPLHELQVDQYVTLGDYNNLTVEIDPMYLPNVEDSEVLEVMNSLYLNYLTKEDGITDRKVENGDTVIIDYVGKKNGVAFDGGTAGNASLTIGSGQFIAGFEDGLIGVMPGETVDLNLTFPEGYHNAELAGQPVVFTVTVHYILPTQIPEDQMKDSVVASIGLPEVETVAQYRDYVREYLESSKQQSYEYAIQSGIIEKLLAQSTFQELPAEMFQKYSDVIRTNLANSAAQNNITVDLYCSYFFQKDSETYIKESAERYLKQDLALQAIANREGLTVGDEELEEKLLELAKQAGLETVEEFIGDVEKNDFRNYFMSEKIMEFLQNKANVADKSEE